jgi:hypothetical protein
MILHRRIQRRLFEYAKNELPPEAAGRVRDHLSACPDCAREVDTYRSLLTGIGSSLSQSGEALPPEYWRSFSSSVMQRIAGAAPVRDVTPGWWEEIRQVLELRPRYYAAALGGAVALVLISFFAWKSFRPRPVDSGSPPQTEPRMSEMRSESGRTTDRVNQYFRKSRLLLVGLSNMEPDDSQRADLLVEKHLSRELVREARFLRSRPLDPRSARLVGDTERIFIELANAGEQRHAPTIDMIRTGIRRENLLFKVRMAESMSDSTLIALAQSRFQE